MKKVHENEKYPNLEGITFEALGTEIDLKVVINNEKEKESAKKDLFLVKAMYEEFTKKFSRFDCESELSKINRNLNVFLPASPEMIEIAQHSLRFNVETLGVFDPRIIDTLESVGYRNDFKSGKFELFDEIDKNEKNVPLKDDLKIEKNKIFFGSRMDFSGIAKGYITDKVSQFLINKGWRNFFVDSGGDMYFHGNNQMGKSWIVDIEGIDYNKIMFALCEKGVATSGISRRKWEIDGRKFHHLINPAKRDQFSFDLKTVTVIFDSAESSDVWAKTLFLMGKKDGIEFAKKKSIPAVFLDYRGGAWISSEIKKFAC